MLERVWRKGNTPALMVGMQINNSHYGEQYGGKKLGIKLPYVPAISLLGIYPEKTTILKDACTPVFIAAIFTVARI